MPLEAALMDIQPRSVMAGGGKTSEKISFSLLDLDEPIHLSAVCFGKLSQILSEVYFIAKIKKCKKCKVESYRLQLQFVTYGSVEHSLDLFFNETNWIITIF